MFLEEYKGGAELTTEAIIKSSPDSVGVEKVHCRSVSIDFLEKNKDSHFIICNFSTLADNLKIYMCRNVNYSIIEYDYKFCQYRSMKKHYASTGKECDCVDSYYGKINSAFYGYASKIWFMSRGQRDIFISKIKALKEERCEVLSSVFSSGDVSFMNSIKNNEKNNKYLILGSNSWIKGTDKCILYAEENNLDFEIISGLLYHELLIKMSTSRGLIFLPLDYDTCPRLVIEAKLLGCELILNDHVQHKDEDWFNSAASCYSYLHSRPKAFWDNYVG
jgi:hypothetical protein